MRARLRVSVLVYLIRHLSQRGTRREIYRTELQTMSEILIRLFVNGGSGGRRSARVSNKNRPCPPPPPCYNGGVKRSEGENERLVLK